LHPIAFLTFSLFVVFSCVAWGVATFMWLGL
jgi:hypothetical protein